MSNVNNIYQTILIELTPEIICLILTTYIKRSLIEVYTWDEDYLWVNNPEKCSYIDTLYHLQDKIVDISEKIFNV